jgi:hypothetical protein
MIVHCLLLGDLLGERTEDGHLRIKLRRLKEDGKRKTGGGEGERVGDGK